MAGSEWIDIGHLLGQSILAGVDYGLHLQRIVFVESQVIVFRFLYRISLCWPPHSTSMMISRLFVWKDMSLPSNNML